jgi:hypothetical protein
MNGNGFRVFGQCTMAVTFEEISLIPTYMQLQRLMAFGYLLPVIA